MQLMVLSNPVHLADEHRLINALFEAGLTCFHLCKPGLKKDEFTDFLQQISPRFYRRIIIHSHYSLIGRFNLAGIHLSHDFLKSVDEAEVKALFKAARSRNLQLGTSVHSIEGAEAIGAKYSYIFLEASFELPLLQTFLSQARHEIAMLKNTKMIGNEKLIPIEQGRRMDVEGIVISDGVWNDFSKNRDVEGAVEKFKQMQAKAT